MTTITPIRKAPDRPDELTERDMRVDLAACYRLIAHFGMDDLVYSHITARVPGAGHQYLLNPYGSDVRRNHGLEPRQGRR